MGGKRKKLLDNRPEW